MCKCGCNTCETKTKGPLLTEGKVKSLLSEGLQYHIDKKIPLFETVYRIGSDKHLALIKEARKMYSRNVIDLCEDDEALIKTHLGEFGLYEGVSVPLDLPMLEENQKSPKFKIDDFVQPKSRDKYIGQIEDVYINKPENLEIKDGEYIYSVAKLNHRGKNAMSFEFKESDLESISDPTDYIRSLTPYRRLNESKMPTQDQVDKFFALTQNEIHYLNSKPVAGQEKTFNKMEVEPWDEYDLSNWNSLVRKAKSKGQLKENEDKLLKIKQELEALRPGTISWIDDIFISSYDGSLQVELDYTLYPDEIKQLAQIATKYGMELKYMTGKNATLVKNKINEDRKYNQEELLRLDLIAHRKFDCDYEKCTDEQKAEVLKDKVKVGVKEALQEAYSGFLRNPEDPDSEKFEPTGAVAEFKEDLRALFGKFKGDLKNPEFIKGVAQIMVNWKSLLRSQLDEAKINRKKIESILWDLKNSNKSSNPSDPKKKEALIKKLEKQLSALNEDEQLDEKKKAKKKEKKDPPLNKPKRGGSKAYYVYVRDPKTKKIKKVSFGSGGLRAKIKNKEARTAFAARHNCKNKKDRTKAGYWSCNLPRYAPALGLGAKMNTFW
jgi:hypothetical protein